MHINNLSELNHMHIDTLQELGNIGMGNAATALSAMLNTRIDMNIPVVALLNRDETKFYLSEMQNVALGVLLNLCGDAEGIILHIIRKSFAEKVISFFFPTEIDDINQIDEMGMSVIQEIGNITSAAYCNALASMTGMFIDISTPLHCMEMANQILQSSEILNLDVNSKFLFINNSFFIDNQEIKSNLLFLPSTGTLNDVFEKLNELTLKDL